MKRVGLITFHRNFNFGAALQCAAMCRLIRARGADPIVIDYAPFEPKIGLLSGWGIRRLGFLGALKKRFFDSCYGKKAHRNFERFRSQNWKTTSKCSDATQISSALGEVSYVVAGSDQVWRFDRPSPYFLHWEGIGDAIKVSYAPCCSSSDQPSGREKEIKEWIREIDFLSVRNDFSCKVIQDLTGRAPNVVADPTLLVEFPSTGDLPLGIPSLYILVYILGEEISGGMESLLRRAKKRHPGCLVVAICPTFLRAPDFPWADRILHGLGPFEWVELIRAASLVITDSFHGAIFCIKFEKPFISYYTEKMRAPRMLDLCDRYHLEGRVVSSAQGIEGRFFTEKPSAETIESIRAHRKESIKFLESVFCA